MKIFISYANEDKSAVRKIALALKSADHTVFFDETSLPPGGSFHDRIIKALMECDLFIFVISPYSIDERGAALNELKIAQTKWPDPDLRLLPVMLSDVPMASLPAALTETVTILRPTGNVAFDIVSQVHQIKGEHKKRGWTGSHSSAFVIGYYFKKYWIASIILAIIFGIGADYLYDK